VNLGDYDQRTSIHLAASEGLLQVIKCLVEEFQADVNVADRWGGLPLDDALRHQNKGVVDYLVAKGARRGKTAVFASDGELLCAAAFKGDVAGIDGLLHQGVDVNSPSYDGRTAVHVATAEGHLHLLTHLIENIKADPNAVDNWGRTPLDLAISLEQTHIEEYLTGINATRRTRPQKDEMATQTIEPCNATENPADTDWARQTTPSVDYEEWRRQLTSSTAATDNDGDEGAKQTLLKQPVSSYGSAEVDVDGDEGAMPTPPKQPVSWFGWFASCREN
jgi:hypothetical protein